MLQKTLKAQCINISILEDHQGVIDGYLYRLQNEGSMRVTGVALYGEELEPMLAEYPTDVLILDIDVPTSPTDPTNYPVRLMIPRILKNYPRLIILVISFHSQIVLIETLVELGIRGYIIKNDSESIKQLPQIIRALFNGSVFFGQHAYNRMKNPDEPQLTSRQLDALSLCVAFPDGTSDELAGRLGITSSTFRNLLSKSYSRLGVRTRTAAVAKMQRLGLQNSNAEPDLLIASSADASEDW
jgi:DNA-binding NarL/FixJ family response regulator